MCSIAWIVGFVFHVCIVDDIWRVLVILDEVWLCIVALVGLLLWIKCLGGCVDSTVLKCD